MKRAAALGFRVHSGWTAMVAISLDEGAPQVLLRQRPHLVHTFTFEFRQPYHTAEKKPLDEARAFIERMQAEARQLASQAIHVVQKELHSLGYQLDRCGLLLATRRPPSDLGQILASHALIHAADGELFRDALTHASESHGLKVFTAKENGLLDTAVEVLHQPQQELARRLTSLGSSLGPPWSQDEKLSALVAWLSLSGTKR